MCLFNYNLPLSFRNKTVYNELLVLHRVPMPWYCFLKNVISIARTQQQRKCYQCWVLGTFLKSQKLVPAKRKKSPIRKNRLPQKFRATRYANQRCNSTLLFSLAVMLLDYVYSVEVDSTSH